MKLLNVDFVKGDDWEAVYVLGKLWEEGHHIDWPYILKNHVVHISRIYYADLTWLNDRGSFPSSLSEVVFAVEVN